LPDLSWYNIPKREKYTNFPQAIPNGYEIYQMAVKSTKSPVAIPSKIYQNFYFWFENIPSGNPEYYDIGLGMILHRRRL
jgi:hypothetical protein